MENTGGKQPRGAGARAFDKMAQFPDTAGCHNRQPRGSTDRSGQFMTIRRGEVVMRDGKVQAEPGTGRFLPRGPYAMIRPRGITPDGFDPAPPPAM